MRPQNQTLLAVIMALCMVAGFIGVYAVGYQYEQTASPERVFVSDSNMEIAEPDLTPLYLNAGYTSFEPHTPAWYHRNVLSSVILKQNITMVYTGNNTWSGAVAGGNTDCDGNSQLYVGVLLPFLKTTMLTEINITMTLPGDADQWLQVYVTSTHNPIQPTLDGGYNTDIALHWGANTETVFVLTHEVTPFEALKMYSGANARPYTYMAIELNDQANDGISAFNLELQVEFKGTPVLTWSLQDSINLVLGLSITGNIIVMAYMTDSLDFGGYRKDLSGKRAWSPKRKSGKRR